MNYFESLLSSKGLPLMLPKACEEQVHKYVEMHQKRSIKSRERTPFRRQIEFWTFSISYALAHQIEPLNGRKGLKKFADTRSVQIGDELSEWLTVVAFSKIGPTDRRAAEPGAIIEVCNWLAGAGAPHVIRKMQENSIKTPLENALDLAESLIKKSS